VSASSLLTKALALLSPDAVRSSAESAGEKIDTMRRLLEGAVPAVLAALTGQVGTAEGATRLLEVIRAGNAADLAGLVFGPRMAEVADTLARWSGAGGAAATQALQASAGMVLKVLTDENSKRGFTASSLADFLQSQHAHLGAFLPAPLRALFGFLPAVGRQAVESVSTLTRAAQTVAVAAVLLGGLFFYRGCGAAPVAVAPPPPVEVAQPAPRQVEVQLPTGKAVNLLEGSFNYELVRFLADKDDRRLPRTFVFDHLNFFTAKTEITPESQPTLDDLVAILAAYPATGVRLEGHTDSQGDPAANQKLSEDRAAAIRTILSGRGIAAARMATAGFGQAKPLATNSTEEGRAQNRRLELVVVKK